MLLLGLKLEFFLFNNSSSRQVKMTVTFNVGPKYFVISILVYQSTTKNKYGNDNRPFEA